MNVFDYQPALPIFLDCLTKRFFMYPTGTYQMDISANDVIRFQFFNSKDFINPYETYLNFTININPNQLTDDQTYKFKCLQVDGSGHSLITRQVIYDPTGRELERINGYSHLMDILKDCNYNPQELVTKAHEGYGGLNLGEIARQCGPQAVAYNLMPWLMGTSPQTAPMAPYTTDGFKENLRDLDIVGAPPGGNVPSCIGVIIPATSYGGIPTRIVPPGLPMPFPYTTPNEVIAGSLQQYLPGGSVSGIANAIGVTQFIGPLEQTMTGGYQAFTPVTAPYGYSLNPLPILIDWDNTVDFSSTPGNAAAPNNVNAALEPAFTPLAYWHPFKSNAFGAQLPPYLAWGTDVATGPYGIVNGGPTATQTLADTFYGWGFQLWDTLTSNDVPNTFNTSIENNPNCNKYSNNNLQGVQLAYPKRYGMVNPFPASFANTCFEPVFSSTIFFNGIVGGIPHNDTNLTWNFKIPLVSGLMGCLIPRSQFRLVPMQVLDGVTLEYQINPKLLFSSWHSQNQGALAYTVSNLFLEMETTIILDSNLDAQIRNTLNDFKLVSTSWYQGPLYSIINGAVPAEIQINLGFQSLRKMLFGFWRNSSYSTALRDTYRLSMGITAWYIMKGTDQYPNVPFQGQAGTNIGYPNNYDFYYQLLRCFDRHWDSEGIAINPHNFSVNFSEFDPAANVYDDNGPNQGCYFKENRCKGKCIFGTKFTNVLNNHAMFTGMNTSKTRPWSLFIEYDASQALYKRPVLFESYFNYDVVFTYNGDTWTVIGRN